MFEKCYDVNKSAYVSCIKINGVPILPPVITTSRRKELLKYKQQAIKLEQRLRNCRELEKTLDHILSTQMLSDRPTSDLSFRGNSHIDDLGLSDSPVANLTAIKQNKKTSLSTDIIDVTQYNSEGIKIIFNESTNTEYKLNSGSDNSNTDTSINKLTDIKCDLDYTDTESLKLGSENNLEFSELTELQTIDLKSNTKVIENNTSLHSSPRPRLIRSNSYTLETPSPILLAHLKKREENINNYKSPSFTRNWSSLENNYIPFEKSEFSSINTIYHNEKSNQDSNKVDCDVNINNNNKANIEDAKSPTIEVFQTDISVQQITVNTVCDNDNKNDSENIKNFYTKDAFDICDPDSQLMQVLKTIPEDYSSQIIELIQKQKIEQQERLERYEKMRKESMNISLDKTHPGHGFEDNSNSSHVEQPLPQDSSNNIYNYTTANDISGVLKSPQAANNSENHSSSTQSNKIRRSSTFSVSPNRSIYYSVTSSSDAVPPPQSPSVKLIDLESDNEEIDISEKFYEYSENSSGKNKNYRCVRSPNISKQLFPVTDFSPSNDIRKDWAASIIGAHVKGYLTRRLLRTEKIQNLIDTIKDALICALQLHNSENIDEADIELHRRLIQQVSAACFSFYDIFFSITKYEQMQIIAADRQRKKEKAKRPLSASSSRKSLNSSRSSSKQKLTPRSQSLTKV